MDIFLIVSNLLVFVVSNIVAAFSFFGVHVHANAVLPFKRILKQAQLYYEVSLDNVQPLYQKCVIITGSTSGIGKSLACHLYKVVKIDFCGIDLTVMQMGATVVISSRTPTKCLETAEYIRKHYPASEGTLVVKPLDVSNLEDVAKFALWYRKNYTRLDILVNNAALNYISALTGSKSHNMSSFTSTQGYDLAFSTNYLGPFLLTELLLPMLLATPHARILQVCSISHLLAQPTNLRCSSRALSGLRHPPLASTPVSAARGGGSLRTAYRVTKLAQMLHTIQLQQRIWKREGSSTDLKVRGLYGGCLFVAAVVTCIAVTYVCCVSNVFV